MDQAELWLELLQQNGCRITAPRRVIVELLANSPRALDAIELFDLSRKVQPGIGLVTVYRTLEKLEKINLIQRVHREDGCHMVMKAAVGHQHYLVCTSCGRTTLFQGDDISRRDICCQVDKIPVMVANKVCKSESFAPSSTSRASCVRKSPSSSGTIAPPTSSP